MSSVIRIKPFHYIHVLDNTENVTKLIVGPKTYTRDEHVKVIQASTPMIMVAPRHYVRIENPVARDEENQVLRDKHGNVKNRHGDTEIRFHQAPFPLYPGERVIGRVEPLRVVAANSALRLTCVREFKQGEVTRTPGEEWLFPGPATYIPRVEVRDSSPVRAAIVKPGEALVVRARKEMKDRNGISRKAGEEWLVRTPGAYLPGVDEDIMETRKQKILTNKIAYHLKAVKSFTDVYKKPRKAGEEWLVKLENSSSHILDVDEELVRSVPVTTLKTGQFCFVLDPVDEEGKNQLGKRELRKGPRSFFLHPGETLEEGKIRDKYVLQSDQALLLKAREKFENHEPGDMWLIEGPCEYIPTVEVDVVTTRKTIVLDENEGIYVRDIASGNVRAEIGKSYLLKANEELWKKELSPTIEDLLTKMTGATEARTKTRVITFKAPHNSAVQVYDYREKKSRVVFGPNLVILQPDEQFTLLSLSGGKPKRPHQIKAIQLNLGPDFMTDIIIVETSDHARLKLKLSYNWRFSIKERTEEAGRKIFQVPDFVGDACKAMASKVRGAVATTSFDTFHKTSAKLIRTAVFGLDENNKVNDEYRFKQNDLTITNIDIQSVEPVDQRTRDALQKSVQLAIEITTKSQESQARHDAERLEQEARGKLECQRILDEEEAEKSRKELLELQAKSASVESTGQASAEAHAKARGAEIEALAQLEIAKLSANATNVQSSAELERKSELQKSEIEHQKKMDLLELERAEKLAKIETGKFGDIIQSIGVETIQAIASAGPRTRARMLKSLGIKHFMISDGQIPINILTNPSKSN